MTGVISNGIMSLVEVISHCIISLVEVISVMIYTMHLVHIRSVLKFATRCPLLLYVNILGPGFLEAIKDEPSLLTTSMAAIDMLCSSCL